ncbi:hypothetical protein U3A55_00075 [Salarchaeum sp. III]|uniref:hypothetical protein n=1 Tax=Salarchaeum sp. III TaxID=3107927 RepID=UPI002EDB6E28
MAPHAPNALDADARLLAGYAVVQVALLSFSYLAVTALGFGSPGFMHFGMPWYLLVPGLWLLVFGLAFAAFAPRVRRS